MSAPPRNAQITAFLFGADNEVRVAVEDVDTSKSFVLDNSETGAADLMVRLAPLVDRNRPPFFCIGAVEGANLAGTLFEELLAAPIPRFIVAQSLYLARAKELALSSAEPGTLLRSYRELFPRTTDA